MDTIKIMRNDDVNVIMHSQYSQLGEEETQKAAVATREEEKTTHAIPGGEDNAGRRGEQSTEAGSHRSCRRWTSYHR